MIRLYQKSHLASHGGPEMNATQIKQRVEELAARSRLLAARADVGSEMTVRIDKRTTFTGKIESVEFREVRRSGYCDLYGVFDVTLVNKFGGRKTFTLRKIPVC
jgi:hypothetical protein